MWIRESQWKFSVANAYSMLATHVKKRGRERGARLAFLFSLSRPGQARTGGGETPEYRTSARKSCDRSCETNSRLERRTDVCVCMYVYMCAQPERRERMRARPVHFVSVVAFSQVICDNDGARVPLGKGSVPPFVFIVLDLGWLGSTSAIYRIYHWIDGG